MSKRQLSYLIAALVGFVALIWSANDWFELFSGIRTGASFCTISRYWNCDRASLSPFGSPLGIPIGAFGALWFWTLGMLGFCPSSTRILRRALILSGFLVILTYATYLTFILKTGCIICYLSYICGLVMIGTGWNLRGRDIFSFKTVASICIVGLIGISIFVGSNLYDLNKQIPEAEFQNWYASLPVVSQPLNSPLQKGSIAPPRITFVEFSDFGCPFCQRAAQTLLPYLETQPDVKLEFFPFPWEASCNPVAQTTLHPHACDWAKAAICANEQGKFWYFHDTIFRWASEAGELPTIDSLAKMDLDQERMKQCLGSTTTSDTLRELIETAKDAGVQSTPTFIVNGRKIEGFKPVSLIKRLVEELRKK